jgi:hypothetical protein
MTPEAKALDAFLSACIDGGMSGQAMGEAMRRFSTQSQPERQPMTEYEISELMRSRAYMDGPTEFIRACERHHGIGSKP